MAIIKLSENEQELSVKVENGDLIALKEIEKKWNFKDKESALRFALAVLFKSAQAGNKLMTEENGKVTNLVPGDGLLRKDSENEPSA